MATIPSLRPNIKRLIASGQCKLIINNHYLNMKRLFLALTMSLGAIASMAQVNFFEGSLSEAIKKAKTEEKLVVVMCSATW